MYDKRVKGEWRGRIEWDNKGLSRQRETYEGGGDGDSSGGGGDKKGKEIRERGKIFINADETLSFSRPNSLSAATSSVHLRKSITKEGATALA